MGKVLHIADTLRRDASTPGDSFAETCAKPLLNTDASIRCADGTFGPPDARMVAKGADRLTLD